MAVSRCWPTSKIKRLIPRTSKSLTLPDHLWPSHIYILQVVAPTKPNLPSATQRFSSQSSLVHEGHN
ncbi:Uncharacterized protein TCM_013600 [Theobroma cacao]|uniref:Uncharacterized protein n=1 Tax=Theobroma cacao TaxID=3641 RepID=A0A061FX54_THECC|nr:Uncharacterized protein TCM_013600 [Theobroma cacao]